MRTGSTQTHMSARTLDKTYDPKRVEDRWYRVWEEQGYFRVSLSHPGEPYAIVIPPPNVTGSLHIGHAFNNTIQDILIRWRRMQGRNTLWVPGMDHAGIATQNVVERQLAAEGLSREQLGREKFVERVWAWKAQSGGTIIRQLKRLGASCDWSRERFTLDEGLSKAVREVFVRLYEERLIYRGERLINWCPRCLTALSDIEVEHEDVASTLYHIRYPLAEDPSMALVVATTRPETMLGDTAVAVHPEDPRYSHLIGKKVRLPLTSREIPIIGDPILVDREFGTGVVKVTPAHDFRDFEAGLRHGLPRLVILDQRAQLDPAGLDAAQVDPSLVPMLRRLPVAQARATVLEALKAQNLLVKTERHHMALGRCYRCKTIVEPLLSPQWFVKVKPLAEPAIKAVEDGRIRIIPATWVNNYLGWMREIKDWCISRQIWWGHRIPAWYCLSCNQMAMTETVVSSSSEKTYTFMASATPIVARQAPRQCPVCQGNQFVQDPDVLDTWFSSALWPFSTLGWPEETRELTMFYPTSTLVTGLDILFFWVARMIMMGLKFMGDVPFRDVYVHALVRDAEGQKMSKSKGNVVDPMDIMDRYGSDALRFTLASLASPGRDLKLAEERIAGYRNFANKIWNAARFILMNLDGPRDAVPPQDRSFADRWILSRLNRTIREVNAALEQYRFDLAAARLYHFIWHEYCDWYLEMVKPVLTHAAGQGLNPLEAAGIRQTLVESFETIQRLLHPFMPFLSEEIWQALPHQGDSIMIQRYPEMRTEWHAGEEIEQAWDYLHQFVVMTRTMRALLDYPPGKLVEVYGCLQRESGTQMLEGLRSYIVQLSRTTLHVVPPSEWPVTRLLRWPGGDLLVGLAIEPAVDLRKALARIKKEREEKCQESSRLESKLGNPDFLGHAPPEVVEDYKLRLHLLHRELALLAESERQLHELLS
jgi:valyl-tRNA synthetase